MRIEINIHMSYVHLLCKQCSTPIIKEIKYLNRKKESNNKGCFCSKKCSAIFYNKERGRIEKQNVICKLCDTVLLNLQKSKVIFFRI